MKLILLRHFERLKAMMLKQVGFSKVTSADCKLISVAIFRETKHLVSETTLKRVFGFAQSKFKPSLFTMDALAEFCGYHGWEHFCNECDGMPPLHGTVGINWERARHTVTRMTGFTLQVLKNRSGIPFGHSISREFIEVHFRNFLVSGRNGMLLIAPAGYGKTLALCHWLEAKLQEGKAGEDNDIFLFFSGHTLTNVFSAGKEINEWLLSLLGYGTEADLLLLLNARQKGKGNFYLIIDGLDEHLFGKDGYQQLMDQLLDIFSLYKGHERFKLVMAMRSCPNEFEDFAGDWFIAGVPLFSVDEISELCNRINPLSVVCPVTQVIENFRYPLYFQFYYQRHRYDFSLTNVDQLAIYELVSDFIQHKVYQGKYADEKVTISQLLTEHMETMDTVYEVPKGKISGLLNSHKYRQAYLELLGIGLLKETTVVGHLKFQTVVRFGNADYLNYNLGKWLLAGNNNRFDTLAAGHLNRAFPMGFKVAVLKWCMFYAALEQREINLDCLASIKLTAPEELEMIAFLQDIKKDKLISVKGWNKNSV